MLRNSISHTSLLPVSSHTPTGKGKRRARSQIRVIYLLLLATAAACFCFGTVRIVSGGTGQHSSLPTAGFTSTEPLVKQEKEPQAVAGATGVKAETLVLYVYAGSDAEYPNNLLHFIREGIHEHDGCEYLIAIQEGPGLTPLDPLPELPSNARFVHHENKCFDLGTIGWMVDNHIVNPGQYKFVIWLNSSVRGPFLPAYVKRRMHWTEALTDRIRGKVKLVGATINCGGAYGVPAVPHVQSYLAATDRVGFQVLRQEGSTFRCWNTMAETVIHSELGASAAIFMAGYNIDCLMLRYQGVNWRSKEALDCNGGLNPIQNNFNDGINVDPFEVMFIKVKKSMRAANWTHVAHAIKFDEWSEHERGLTAADLQANEWTTKERPRLLAEADRRGSKCFDTEFYVSASPTELGYILKDADPEAAAWRHFLDSGIKDGRPFRYTC